MSKKWMAASFCEKCDEELSFEDIHMTDSTCPYCGNRGDYYTPHYERVYYEIKAKPIKNKWWQFWLPKGEVISRRIYKDEESEQIKDDMLDQLKREGL